MATIPIGAQVMKRYSQIILFSDISRQKIKVCACRFETQFILLTGKGCTKGKHKHKQLSGSNVSPSRSGSGDATPESYQKVLKVNDSTIGIKPLQMAIDHSQKL